MPRLKKQDEEEEQQQQQRQESELRRQQQQQQQRALQQQQQQRRQEIPLPQPQPKYGNNSTYNQQQSLVNLQPPPDGYLGRRPSLSGLPLPQQRNNNNNNNIGININTMANNNNSNNHNHNHNPAVAAAALAMLNRRASPTGAVAMVPVHGPASNPYALSRFQQQQQQRRQLQQQQQQQQQLQNQQQRQQQPMGPLPQQQQLVGIHHNNRHNNNNNNIDSNSNNMRRRDSGDSGGGGGGGSSSSVVDILEPTPIGPGATVTDDRIGVMGRRSSSASMSGGSSNNGNDGVMGRRGSNNSGGSSNNGNNNDATNIVDHVDHNQPTIAELAAETFNRDDEIDIDINDNKSANTSSTHNSQRSIDLSLQPPPPPPPPSLGVGLAVQQQAPLPPPPSSLGVTAATAAAGDYSPDLFKNLLSPTPLPPTIMNNMTNNASESESSETMKTKKIPKMQSLSSTTSSTHSSTNSLLKDDNDKNTAEKSARPAVASKTLAGLSAMHKKLQIQDNKKKKKKSSKGSSKKKKKAGINNNNDTAAAIRLLKKPPPPPPTVDNNNNYNEYSKNNENGDNNDDEGDDDDDNDNDNDNRRNTITLFSGNRNRPKMRGKYNNNEEDEKFNNPGDDDEKDNNDPIDSSRSGGGGGNNNNSNSNKKSGVSRGRGRPRINRGPGSSSRQNNSDDRRTNNKTTRRCPPPQLNIVNDEEPDRLTNPLLAIVPASIRKLQQALSSNNHNNDGIGISSPNGGGEVLMMGAAVTYPNNTATTKRGSAGKGVGREGNEGGGGADPSNVTGTIPVGEFMNSVSIVFHRPDTYPLSFLARLLGFDVDVPDCNNMLSFMPTEQQQQQLRTEQGTNVDSSISPLESSSQIQTALPRFPMPLPDSKTLPLRKDTVFLKIPVEGNFFQQQQLQMRQKHRHNANLARRNNRTTNTLLALGDLDDQRTLDYIDPVYKTFLQHGWEDHRCKPTASSTTSKAFILKQQEQQPVRQHVMEMAQNRLGLSTDWTFQDWGSFQSHQEEIEQEKQNNAKSFVPDISGPIATANDDPSPSQQHRRPRRHNSSSKGGRNQQGPIWTIDGKQVFSHLPHHIFGILASYQGQPVAILKYHLHWYQLPTSQNDNDQKKSNTNDPLEAELVVVVHGFGLRTGDNDKSSNDNVNDVNGYDNVNANDVNGNDVNGNDVNGNDVNCNGSDCNGSEHVGESTVISTPNNTSPLIHETTSIQKAKDMLVDQEQVMHGEVHIDGPQTIPPVQDGAKTDEKKIRDDEPVSSLAPVTKQLNDTVKVVMLAMALEHTRACDVWYGLWETPESFVERNETCFRMVKLPRNDDVASEEFSDNCKRNCQPMICDLKKCSSSYAILKLKEEKDGNITGDNNLESTRKMKTATITKNNDFHVSPERLLVKMPSFEEARTFFEGPISNTPSRHSKRGTGEDLASNVSTHVFTGAVDEAREIVLKLRAKIDTSNENHVEIHKLSTSSDCEGDTLVLPSTTPEVASQTSVTEMKPTEELPRGINDEISKLSPNETGNGNENDSKSSISWDLLRCFPIKEEASQTGELESEILSELRVKQEELVDMEKSLEPKVRGLLAKAIEERMKYELPESRERREGAKRTLLEYKEVVARRKEFDQVCQDQLEEDMNAVCSICNDGEVTPDNQILFCEACNVAVHQICYGVEKIPEGDYYCIACRHFKRDQMILSKPDTCLKDGATAATRPDLPPLPIVCELCPVKHGAFTRLDTPMSASDDSSVTKWVHMTCAKWQGLNMVNLRDASLVEDVTLLKQYFRRDNIWCCICKGMRGAYHTCRFEGCENHCHITCARESGLCEVVHGDSVDGTVPDNAWTLLCPDHSQIDNEEDKNWTRVEELIRAAKEFPVDPMPPPLVKDLKPFNKCTGEDRKVALAVREYEDIFMEDVLSRKLSGVRCEVCDTIEDVNGKNLCRCIDCGCVVCFACEFTDDPGQRSFQCHSCRFLAGKDDELIERNQERPECSLCNQKDGLLIKAKSKPILKQGFWKNNPIQYEKSLFTKANWAHLMCA
jgi:hypothetical protein